MYHNHPPPPKRPRCTCPDGHGPMTRCDGPLAAGGPVGVFWRCATCGLERLTPDGRVVAVPDAAKPPKATLCWKQSPAMVRCDRRRQHLGPHSWEGA